MLIDTEKVGSLYEIQNTDFRAVLFFLMEYPIHKKQINEPKKIYTPGDLTDFA